MKRVQIKKAKIVKVNVSIFELLEKKNKEKKFESTHKFGCLFALNPQMNFSILGIVNFNT